MRVRAGAGLLFAALNLASCKGQPPADNAAHAKPSPKSAVPARVITTADFTLLLPDGYDDVTADIQKNAPQYAAAFAVSKSSGGYKATIVVQKVPIPGGSFADPASCAQTGNGLMTGGTESPGINGTLKSATIIDGPVGKACQIHLLAPEGISLITELHKPGNTLLTPKDVWLMTCNHADGDQSSESTCRSTLAAFRFTH
ncbi:MAG: hypothetical protein M4D80_18365 [Myxococcota bacterium]|nr:hypothetical protein [Myxococcota bacterium]